MAKYKNPASNMNNEKLVATKQTLQYTLPTSSHIKKSAFVKPASLHSYAYVMHDLRKTAITSFTLIGLQVLLYVCLTHHIVRIPGVSF